MLDNYTAGHWFAKFTAEYNSAMTFIKEGDNGEAVNHFDKAGNFLKEYIACLDENDRAKYIEMYNRICNIASSLPINTSSEHTPKIFNQKAADDDLSSYDEFYSILTLDNNAITFDDVIGFEQAKNDVIRYVIRPKEHPEAYTYSYLKSNALLLTGKPGTGKTTFAKAVAKELKQPFILVKSSSLINAYIGQTAKNIDSLFESLRSMAAQNSCGLTVFFDEFDELAKDRNGDDKTAASAVPALLRNMDGIIQNKDFLILANTNCKDALDKGILSRFSKVIEIPLPGFAERKALFDLMFKELETQYLSQIDFDACAEDSEGLSGRDIGFICNDIKLLISEHKAGYGDALHINDTLRALIATKLTAIN